MPPTCPWFAFALALALAAAAFSCAPAEVTAPPSGGAPGVRSPDPHSARTGRVASESNAEDSPAPSLGPEVRYAVQLGEMRNGSGLRGEELTRALGDSVRLRIRAVKGTAVVVANPSLVRQASERGVPVITLDGSVTELTEAIDSSGLRVRARVEFALRREHVLKATLSGAATAVGSSPTISDNGRRSLEEGAIDGAVQSALRDADRALMGAAR